MENGRLMSAEEQEELCCEDVPASYTSILNESEFMCLMNFDLILTCFQASQNSHYKMIHFDYQDSFLGCPHNSPMFASALLSNHSFTTVFGLGWSLAGMVMDRGFVMKVGCF